MSGWGWKWLLRGPIDALSGRFGCAFGDLHRPDDGRIGGHIWGGVLLVGGDRAHDPSGGPHIAAIAAVETLAKQWQDEPLKRPTIERKIMDLAHSLGW